MFPETLCVVPMKQSIVAEQLIIKLVEQLTAEFLVQFIAEPAWPQGMRLARRHPWLRARRATARR